MDTAYQWSFLASGIPSFTTISVLGWVTGARCTAVSDVRCYKGVLEALPSCSPQDVRMAFYGMRIDTKAPNEFPTSHRSNLA